MQLRQAHADGRLVLAPKQGPLASAFCLLCLSLLLPHTCLFPMKGFFKHDRHIPGSHFTGSGEGSAPWKCKAPQFQCVPGTMRLCFSQIVFSTPPSWFHPPYKAPSLIPDSALAAAWATGTAHCSSSLPKGPYPGEPSVVSQQVLPQFHQKPRF